MISQYMEAGYVAIAHCRSDMALEWVNKELNMPAKYADDNITILVNIGDTEFPMFVQSKYYWENETLWKKQKQE